MAAKTESDSPVIVLKTYDFVLWLCQRVRDFDRAFKFTLGDRIVQSGIDFLTGVVTASYSNAGKAAILKTASTELTRLRYLIRLAKDLKLLALQSYGHASRSLEEIGRMLGGWMKAGARQEV
ncbi:MAG: diversity-generating retroelement protein Avd [Acidobacteria bacterium]|nr:diversity-generating retroelement protein Avd [Acidobacteriota bacterium]